jgi:hypothetical protein
MIIRMVRQLLKWKELHGDILAKKPGMKPYEWLIAEKRAVELSELLVVL